MSIKKQVDKNSSIMRVIEVLAKLAALISSGITVYATAKQFLGSAPVYFNWLPYICVFVVLVAASIGLVARRKTANSDLELNEKNRTYIVTGWWRISLLAFIAVVSVSFMAIVVRDLSERERAPFVVLLAGLDTSDESDEHGVILELRRQMKGLDADIQDIKAIETEAIVDPIEGDEAAIRLGKKHGADLVVWGTLRTPGAGSRRGRARIGIVVTPVTSRLVLQDREGSTVRPKNGHIDLDVSIEALADLAPQRFVAAGAEYVLAATLGSLLARAGQEARAVEFLDRALTSELVEPDPQLFSTAARVLCCVSHGKGRYYAEQAFAADSSAEHAQILARYSSSAGDANLTIDLMMHALQDLENRHYEAVATGRPEAAELILEQIALYNLATASFMANEARRIRGVLLNGQFVSGNALLEQWLALPSTESGAVDLVEALTNASPTFYTFAPLVAAEVFAKEAVLTHPKYPDAHVMVLEIAHLIGDESSVIYAYSAFSEAKDKYMSKHNKNEWYMAEKEIEDIREHKHMKLWSSELHRSIINYLRDSMGG